MGGWREGGGCVRVSQMNMYIQYRVRLKDRTSHFHHLQVTRLYNKTMGVKIYYSACVQGATLDPRFAL